MSARFRRRRLRLPGSPVEIALIDFGGEGPPALLHHANGFCAALFAPLARRLAARFHVFAMDARGHGDSSRPGERSAYAWENFGADAAGVAESLAAEHASRRIALGLGHSFGGTALLAAAALRPGLFERLVLVDPVIPPPERPIDAERPVMRGAGLADAARRRRQVWPDRATARAAWQGKNLFADWQPEVFELYLAEALRDRPDGAVELKCAGEVEAAIFESGAHFDAFALAPRVRAPVLIQRAARGNFPKSWFERLAREMPDARVEEVDAGHLIPMERPDLVAAAALAFAAPGAQDSTG